jgi:hypothetical protein
MQHPLAIDCNRLSLVYFFVAVFFAVPVKDWTMQFFRFRQASQLNLHRS